MYWAVEEFLYPGEYRVDIFADNYKIGTRSFTLKQQLPPLYLFGESGRCESMGKALPDFIDILALSIICGEADLNFSDESLVDKCIPVFLMNG